MQATDFFMEITGVKTGKVEGSTTQKGREKQIALMSVEYEVTSPRDASTGLATGKRQHKPIKVVAKMDKSAPKLFTMLVNNENVTTAKIECWSATTIAGATGKGGQEKIYTFEFKNGTVAEFRHFTQEDGTLCYEAHFTFDEITVTALGGIMGTDNWLSAT